jgi:sulfur-carrier protein
MRVNVLIPGQLVADADGRELVVVEGDTVREALDDLVARHPALSARLFADGRLKRIVNVYVGDEDIRLLEGLDTRLAEGAELSLVPAIAGGQGRAPWPS